MNIKLNVLAILGVVLLLSCEAIDIRGRGFISITTQPTGCEVYLDGEATGDTTPCVLADIIKGEDITLRLVKEDYLDWSGTVKVSGVDTLFVDKNFTGSLKVTSNPPGASIILDGEATSKITPYTFDSLVVGSHSLRLEHEGAATLDSSIVIVYGEQAEVNVKLNEYYGHIQVNSTPTGAEIWLDGSNTGYTTDYLLGNVGVGSHELKLIKEGYVEWDTTVAVSEGQTTTINATLEEATGNIQVNSTPTGATIYLDGSNTDKTTNVLLENVSVGSHTIKLVKDGYVDWQQEVMVNEDQTTTINANLSAETGKIQVNSTPTGASIYLDGSNTGETTNALLEDVTPGEHTIKLLKFNYLTWDTTITVFADQTVTINVTLEERLKWRYQTGDNVFSSPAIGSDGTIYVGSDDNYLYALTPSSQLKWRYETGDYVRSSPAIGSDGTVYVGSDDNYLYALTPSSQLKWRYETGDYVRSSPAIGSDGTVYVGSYDYLYVINPNGTLKWWYQTGHIVFSSPAVDSDGTIYVGSYDNYLYALTPSGSLKWRYQTGSYVSSSPAIGSDGTIYVGSWDNYLYAIRPSGSLKWRYKTNGLVCSSPAIGSDGTIYVGSWDNYLYALSPSGFLKWRYRTGYIVSSSPAIGSDGTIYVGSEDNYLYALTPSGSLKWRYKTNGLVSSSPAIGSDGTIYVGSYDDYLYAIRSESKGLADSPWPKFRHDNQNTGRYGGP